MVVKNEEKWQGISSSTLKILAVITMLIDHFALAVLWRYIIDSRNTNLYNTYNILRQIGRFAFPIYCFMIVEGLKYTHNKWKYAIRLCIFALISEIPFDLAFSSQLLEFNFQNVYFTLAIGLITLIIIDELKQQNFNIILKSLLIILISFIGMILANFLRTDYDWRGIACILILYFLQNIKPLQLIICYIAFIILLSEFAALPAFLLLFLYKGKKGFSGKAFFYTFYPVHLIVLYIICMIMNISYISAI